MKTRLTGLPELYGRFGEQAARQIRSEVEGNETAPCSGAAPRKGSVLCGCGMRLVVTAVSKGTAYVRITHIYS